MHMKIVSSFHRFNEQNKHREKQQKQFVHWIWIMEGRENFFTLFSNVSYDLTWIKKILIELNLHSEFYQLKTC